MALEPVEVEAQGGTSPQLVDMTRRFWIGGALTIPVAPLEMGGHLTNLHMLIGQRLSNWVQLVLTTAVSCCGRAGPSSNAGGRRSDPIKNTTPAAVAALKAAGIRIVMLTGDNATTARGCVAARHHGRRGRRAARRQSRRLSGFGNGVGWWRWPATA